MRGVGWRAPDIKREVHGRNGHREIDALAAWLACRPAPFKRGTYRRSCRCEGASRRSTCGIIAARAARLVA